MKIIDTLKNKFIIITIITFVFLLILYLILKTFSQNISVIPSSKSVITANIIISPVLSELPTRIKIPKIGVNSLVEHVGLTHGAVDSPIGVSNAAWFSEGPIPGLIGNAIIDGHSGWKNNTPAVFDNLKKLNKGDKIYIENGAGIISTFIVTKLKIYKKDDIAFEIFNSNDNKSHLNLITCTGVWNTIENSQEDRIVVFADLE